MNSTRTSDAPTTGTWLGRDGRPGEPRARTGRRTPRLLIGALCVVTGLGGALWWSQTVTGPQVAVLVATRPVAVGHALGTGDVRAVPMTPTPGLATVPAERAETVLGHRVAHAVGAGAVLSPDTVGPVPVPAGQAVSAVRLQPGAAPPELAAGDRVAVVRSAQDPGAAGTDPLGGSTADEAPPWQATVTGVSPAAADGATVLSLQLASAAATELARVPAGGVAVVLLGVGDR